MLDWTLSKIIISIMVAGLIIFSVLFFIDEKNNFDQSRLQNVANIIAAAVNELSRTQANVSLNLTFDPNGVGVRLEHDIGGSYTIRFSINGVVLEKPKFSARARFDYSIHLWNPKKIGFNTTEHEIIAQDRMSMITEFSSGTDIVLERCLMMIDGELQYHTFGYAGFTAD